jgi:hypothetical protein
MGRLWNALVFLLMVGGLAVGLRLLREFPTAGDSDLIHPYGTLEVVQRRFKQEHLLTPAYFPEALEWPPFEIFAGRDPGFVAMLHFRNRRTGQIVLAIGQAEGKTEQIPSRIDPKRVVSTRSVDINGTTGQLALALCADDKPCNRVTFTRDGRAVTVVGRLAEAELLKFARSLH